MNYNLLDAIDMVSNTPFEMVAKCGKYEIYGNEKDIIISYGKYSTRTITKYGEVYVHRAVAQAELFGAPFEGWEISYIAEETDKNGAISKFEEGSTILAIDEDGCPSIFNIAEEQDAGYVGRLFDSIEENSNEKLYVITDEVRV